MQQVQGIYTNRTTKKITAIQDNLLYKAEKPSVRLSVLFGTLITQLCQHRLKQDLLEMKALFLRIAKCIFTSL